MKENLPHNESKYPNHECKLPTGPFSKVCENCVFGTKDDLLKRDAEHQHCAMHCDCDYTDAQGKAKRRGVDCDLAHCHEGLEVNKRGEIVCGQKPLKPVCRKQAAV